MQLLVKVVSGDDFMLRVELRDTIDQVREKVQELTGIPCNEQRLIFAAKELEGNRTVSDYNLQRLLRPLYLVRTAPKTPQDKRQRAGALGGA